MGLIVPCSSFAACYPRLAETGETWAVDLLGFGFTERPQDVNITPRNDQNPLLSVLAGKAESAGCLNRGFHGRGRSDRFCPHLSQLR